MSDAFSGRTRRPSNPAITLFAITPSDDADLTRTSTALNVATSGLIRMTTADGSICDITVHPGQAFPIRARRVWLTGTSATGIPGLV